MSVSHEHQCTACHQWFFCNLDCGADEDGAGVCGPCAEKAFDAIIPQEKAKLL